jgi:hypothetical protein
MTPGPRANWRHERDKYGVVHRAWSIPTVRSNQTGDLLWHRWCRGGTRAVTIADGAPLTCFWCLRMSFNERKT